MKKINSGKCFVQTRSRASVLLAAIVLAAAAANAQVTIGSDALPQATLDIVGAAGETGKAFRMTDGNQADGRVLTVTGNNGVATWQPPFTFHTAVVDFASKTRILECGTRSSVLSNPTKIDEASILSSTITGLSVSNDNITIPAGDYLVYFTGDIANAEYAYVLLRRVSNNSNVLSLVYGERLARMALLHLDADAPLYLAIGGIDPNPSSYYLTAAQYAAGLTTHFTITFMKYQ